MRLKTSQMYYGNVGLQVPQVGAINPIANLSEQIGTYQIQIGFSNTAAVGEDITLDLILISGDSSVVGGATNLPVTITAGQTIGTTANISIDNDPNITGTRTVVYEIQNISGGSAVIDTSNDTVTLNIQDTNTGGGGIPAPNNTYEDDFTTIRTSGYYNLQGTQPPTWDTVGVGGKQGLLCEIPVGAGTPRSELSWIGSNLIDTGSIPFTQNNMSYDQNYSMTYEFKFFDPGNERGNLVQLHASNGTPSGVSPQLSLEAWCGTTGNEFKIRRDGIDATRDPIIIPELRPTNIFGKWCKLVMEWRYNHGNRTDNNQTGTPVADWRDGFYRFYLTIGTETTLPADPTSADLIATYDGYLGILSSTEPTWPFYIKSGPYFSELTSTGSVLMHLNRVYVQDQVQITADKVGDGSVPTFEKWDAVELEFDSASSFNVTSSSTFRNYALDVTFTSPTNNTYTVPGFFNGSGTSSLLSGGSENGVKWKCIFTPNEIGIWGWTVSFKTGTDVAINGGGTGVDFDGDQGTFQITGSTKSAPDLRALGMVLPDATEPFMTYAETGNYVFRVGPDSPENFLNFQDFTDTPSNTTSANSGKLRNWNQHAGDRTSATNEFLWGTSKGANMLGALEYLSSKGMNTISFLLFASEGDDNNIWPHRGTGSTWASLDQDTFAIRKLAEWDQIFKACDKLGLIMHFKLQETENELLMDNGALGTLRTLYYREMIARFGYHLGVIWNMGEEYEQATSDLKDFVQYFWDTDPYRHLTVVHTRTFNQDAIYDDMTGIQSVMTGASIQSESKELVNTQISKWRTADPTWVVMSSEFGPANGGAFVDPSYAGTLVRTDKTNNGTTKVEFAEANDRVVMDATSINTPGGNWYWGTPEVELPNAGYTSSANPIGSFVLWNEDISDYDNISTSNSSDSEAITYYFKLNSSGEYRIQFYSWQPNRSPENGDDPWTANNDIWMRLPDTGGRGGSSATFSASAWEKVFQSSAGPEQPWVWTTRIEVGGQNYNEIYIDSPGAGVYRLQLAGRSALFAISRIVIWRKAGTNESTATNLANAESTELFTIADHRADLRYKVLWATICAGGDGVEYYFGSETGAGDLYAEDWRTRDEKWDDMEVAKTFFETYIAPDANTLTESNSLLSSDYCYCLAQGGGPYVIYKPAGDIPCTVDISGGGTYDIRWYDPRNGGSLQTGTVSSVAAGNDAVIGNPPSSTSLDWVAYLTLQ